MALRRGLFVGLLTGLSACGDEPGEPSPDGSTPDERPPAEVVFVDATEEWGLDWSHFNGASGNFYLPETMSGGGGFFDADADGDPDLLLIPYSSWPPSEDDPGLSFWRNDGTGHFEEATEEVGLGHRVSGMGMVAADHDSDGDADLLITGVGGVRFFVNEGGRFREATDEVGLGGLDGWSTAATFFDADRDGRLDLWITEYVEWRPELERPEDCVYAGGNRDYCPVTLFPRAGQRLFHNLGDGSFADVSEAAGLAGHEGKSLGICVVDLDLDGWLDVFVANDTVPSQLFINRGELRFEERGFELGLATDRFGSSFAGMGVDCSWEDDGRLCIAVGNFSGEPTTFFVQDGEPSNQASFVESSRRRGISRPSLPRVTFGLVFLDVDLDGDQDLFQVNGHVGYQEESEGIPYRQPSQLFLRDGDRFRAFDGPDDGPLAQAMVGRACATADVDADGDLDLLLIDNGGRGRLLRNDTPRKGRPLRLRLVGTLSNPDAIGALVRVHTSRGVMRDRVMVGNSYLAQNELSLSFGLDPADSIERIEIDWPSGLRSSYDGASLPPELLDPEAGKVWVVKEEADAAPRLDPPAGAGRSLSGLSADELLELEDELGEDVAWCKAVGAALLAAGRPGAAIAPLERARELQPGDHVVHFLLLRCRNAIGGNLTPDVGRLLRAFPDLAFLSQHTTYYLMNLGEYAVAAEVLLRCTAETEEEIPAAVHFRLGRCLSEIGRGDEALLAYVRASQADPEDFGGLINAAYLHLSAGRDDEAIKLARRAVERRPDVPATHEALSRALARRSPKDALASMVNALELAPLDFRLRLRQMELLEAAGQISALLPACRKLLNEFPDEPIAHVRLCRLAFVHDKETKALRMVKDAVDKFPENFEVLLLSAELQQKSGRRVKSVDNLLRRARAVLPPDDPGALERLEALEAIQAEGEEDGPRSP